jgi:carbapenam-3-carboxylate synthase
MSYSFVAAPHADRSALVDAIAGLGWKNGVIDAGLWSVAVQSGSEPGAVHVSNVVPDMTLVFVGEILNRPALTSMLCLYDSLALTANDAELVHLMIRDMGTASLALVEGGFVGLLINRSSNSIAAFSDVNGLMPCYITLQSRPWIASEIKLLRACPQFEPEFVPAAKLIGPELRADNYTPLTNLRKVKPGEVLNLGVDGYGMPMFESSLYHAFRPRHDRVISRTHALGLIDMLMRDSLKSCLEGAGRAGIPLSGGLDSSLVTALAMQSVKQLSTFSIGTELSNEFEFAQQVARHLGTSHTEFMLSDEDVLTGLLEAIYFNEIYDGLSAEIQAPLLALYRKSEGRVDTLITGYGSDLLFGGVLPLQSPARAANLVLWEQVYRTRSTGEFSSFGARHYGMRVRHPFWSNRLIGFCLDLCPALKVSTDEVKIVLREYAAAGQLLPHNIIWRKKIGIHEGSAINRMFANKLDIDVSRYDVKTQFSYFVYRRFFEHGETPWTRSPDAWMQQFAQHLRKP